MSSSGAVAPWAANASRAAAIRRSTLRCASARRARTAVANGGRLSVGVVFIRDLLNGDSLRIVLQITGGDLRIGAHPITSFERRSGPRPAFPCWIQGVTDLMTHASPALPAA